MTKRDHPGSNGLSDHVEFTSIEYQYDTEFAYNKGLKPSHHFNSTIRQIYPNPKVTQDQTHNPSQCDFEIVSQKAIRMGYFTRFIVKGHFERKKKDIAARAAQGTAGQQGYQAAVEARTFNWEKIPHGEVADEATRMMLAPGWWEYLVKGVDVFHNTAKIATSQENKYLVQHLNRFLDAYQDKDVLNLFALQNCHPNKLFVPFEKDSYNFNYSSWKTYAAHTLDEDEPVEFEWYPRDVWPFFQGPNFTADKGYPRAVPMPCLGNKLSVRVSFVDDWSTIFKKATGNDTEYRFRLTDFHLVVEEAELSLGFYKGLFSTKKTLFFPGVARKMEWATIPAEQAAFNMTFHETFMPEGVLVFCLDKRVPNGTYSFAKDASGKIFKSHNIANVDVAFDSERLFIKHPQPGEISLDEFETLRFRQHILSPIFGVKPDVKAFSLLTLHDGGQMSEFPHVYFPLTALGGSNETRIVPAHNDGSCLGKKAKLEVSLKFKANGAQADVIYVFVTFFTNKNLGLNCKDKVFFSPHGVPQY